ncbi:type IV pilus modification protein PilV [Dyella psychrodurans]|uniref:Type IV pilus modification protein PilV n=1 Tax=Dyella psychrodurans TaxID=1927960 RepID=A0A370XBQ8_9GAMM|nr:type IV pilus modification protein PilV [Dyella psychrodurans]RDS85707.1 type IV pilus modification protein PilV [Dyella psychrodurans]
MQCLRRQRGVSLIEVLVAVLVCSAGLVGVAGLLVTSARSNHAAYLRTQVTLLAQGMADRMRANPVGVWSGGYNGSFPNGATQDCQLGCTPGQLARHDQGVWSSQLQTLLPSGAQATIACRDGGAASVPGADPSALRSAYGGSCTMTMTWTESGVGAAGSIENDRASQTFAWEFQP